MDGTDANQTKFTMQKCILIVGDNLVYLFGVACLAWAVFDVLVLFWVENLLLGIFGLFRLLVGRRPAIDRRIYAAFFYVLALGCFSFIFGLFVWTQFSGLDVPGDRQASLLAIQLVLLRPQVLIAAAVLTGFQLWDFLFVFLGTGRFRWADGEWEMRHVGIRMFLLTLALLLGAGLLRDYRSSVPVLVLLVLVKTSVELGFARNDRVLEANAPAAVRRG